MDGLNDGARLELIKHFVEIPQLRTQLRSEHIAPEPSDPLRILFDTMQLMDRQGELVTWENLKVVAGKFNRSDLIDLINEAREVVPVHGAAFLANTTREDFNLRKLFAICNEALRMVGDKLASDEIDEFLEQNLRSIVSDTRHTTMQNATTSAFGELGDIWSGRTPAMWKTGHEQLDMNVCWGPRQIAMIAAAQKQGKSRTTVDWIMRMMERNVGLDVQWYTFEMRPEELIICYLAWMTGIETRVISGKSRTPNAEEQDLLRKAKKHLDGLPIKFFNTKMNMSTLRKDIKSNGASKDSVIVIDNVGLIQQDAGRTDNQHDDHVAAELVDIRDTTNSLIIPLHHLSKANEHHFRRQDQFAPRQSDLRGSNRWGDYVNTLIMLHRVEQYPILAQDMTPEDWEAARGKMSIFVPLNRGNTPIEIIAKHELHICRMKEHKVADVQ